MKKWFNPEQITTVISITLAGLLLIGVYFLILNINILEANLLRLLSVLTPFVYGIILAFLLGPFVRFFELNIFGMFRWKTSLKRLLAVILTLLITLEITILFFSFIIPQIVLSLGSISVKLPEYVIILENLLNEWMAVINLNQDWSNLILDSSENLLQSFISTIQAYLPKLLGYSWQFTKTVFNLIVGIAIAIYIILDKERFVLQVKKFHYFVFGQKITDDLIDLSRLSLNTMHRFILGKALDSLIIGVICYLGMLLLKLEYPVLISVVIGITNMIPVFGPFIGAVPGALILLIVSPIQALWFILFIIVLQQFDGNYLGPRILGDSMGLPSLWIMFAIIVGGGYFGLVGMFMGVPIFAVIYLVFKRLIHQRLNDKAIIIK